MDDPFASGEIPPIGLGTYNKENPPATRDSVLLALDIGYRHIDSAQYYGNETYVGRAVRESSVDREDMFVTTKVWNDRLDYDGVLRSTDESLEKLDVDSVDMLYVHWPADRYDAEETLSAFTRLLEEGKVQRIGVCNFTLPLLDEALDACESPIFAHQVEMHPLLQQRELHQHAVRHDMYLVAYSPFRKGTLLDQMQQPVLEDVAEAHDATPYQVVLAWLIQKKKVLAIPKASGERHLRQNFEAHELRLTEGEVRRIDAIDREDRLVVREFSPW